MTENDLSQMGSASVVKTTFNGNTAIRKSGINNTEYYFDTEISQPLNLKGIHLPNLFSHSNHNLNEIIIEYLPLKPKQSDWKDNRFLKNISALHQTDIPIDQDKLFTFNWSEEKTQLALPLFASKQQNNLEKLLRCFHEKSAEIFYPISIVSGDTNINNWGLRKNGEAVLFDWERFGCASPAIDLAPLIPGLPDKNLISEFCNAYHKQSSMVTTKTLITHTIISLAWIVIEVVNILQKRNNPSLTSKYMDWFDKVYLDWLKSSVKEI